MLIDFQHLQQLIADCKVDDAISALSEAIPALGGDTDGRARAFYLLGNAYGKLGNWRDAIHNYCCSMELDPDGPAAEAYRRACEIVDFYNLDLYHPYSPTSHPLSIIKFMAPLTRVSSATSLC